ncbi:MAG TPA: hypothetical protein VIC08_12905, partial [Cellvibrionaceae bacterium]
PDFEVKIWGNKELQQHPWKTRKQMDLLIQHNKQYAGIADLMRWEILLDEGGFALDADSVCVAPLPAWLFDCNLFAVWENEYVKPGLVANGYVGAEPGHQVIAALVQRFVSSKNLARRFVWRKLKFKRTTMWKTTGPLPFTEEIMLAANNSITLLPSHFFLPRHHSGNQYQGQGPVDACELFSSSGSTHFDPFLVAEPAQLIADVRKQLGMPSL